MSLAYGYFADGRYYPSVVAFNQVIDDYPDDGLLYFGRAQAQFAVGNYHLAHKDLVAGMNLIPDWPEVNFNMEELYGDPTQFDAQLQALEDWVEKHPWDWRSHFVLGYVYYFLQEYEWAQSELTYALAQRPEHPHALRLLQAAHEREAEMDEN